MKLNFNVAGSSKFSYQLFLLPNLFKIIGLIITLGALTVFIYMLNQHSHVYHPADMLKWKFHLKNIAVVGMMMMVFAKDKREDGRSGEIRAMVFGGFILYCVFKVAIEPEMDLYMGWKEPMDDAQSMVFASLFLTLLGRRVIKFIQWLILKFTPNDESVES